VLFFIPLSIGYEDVKGLYKECLDDFTHPGVQKLKREIETEVKIDKQNEIMVDQNNR